MRKGLLRLKLAKRLKKGHKVSSEKVGLPPGTLTYTGKKKDEKFQLRVINYDSKKIEEKHITVIDDCEVYLHNRHNSWINVDGISHVDEVEKLGAMFGMDGLILEDLLDVHHRPKMEIFDDYLFLNIKEIKLKGNEGESEIDIEQVSFVLGKGWLLTFQEEVGDDFEGVRRRLRDSNNELRKYNTDYLFYRMVDTMVDNYFLIIENISDEIEKVEDEMLSDLNDDLRWKMQVLRKELIQLRKAVMPLREIMGSLAREDNKFIEKSTMRYFHDVYDHIIQLHDYIDSQRDMIASLNDLYLSGVSHRMNQVMKILTVISTIFIPLTFIVGVYGMNFKNMPELTLEHGYLYAWIVMVAIVIMMLFFFRRKKWL